MKKTGEKPRRQIVSRTPNPALASVCASSPEEALRKLPWGRAVVAIKPFMSDDEIGWMIFESVEDCEKWKRKAVTFYGTLSTKPHQPEELKK